MGKKKILIVEDNSDVRLGYHILFKVNHYDTVFATDPLSSFAEALNHRPDMIILDLGLTAGDGFTVLDLFKAASELQRIPIVVVSGADMHTIRARALASGAKACLQKPAENADLLAVVREFIGESDEGAPAELA
jgi:two-component system KDP operon response regulator KdpE